MREAINNLIIELTELTRISLNEDFSAEQLDKLYKQKSKIQHEIYEYLDLYNKIKGAK